MSCRELERLWLEESGSLADVLDHQATCAECTPASEPRFSKVS